MQIHVFDAARRLLETSRGDVFDVSEDVVARSPPGELSESVKSFAVNQGWIDHADEVGVFA
ncbi:MAG: hypothetical protein E6Q76_07405 [Rhizobium sp.]|nr:MAG: hypothetical protein E6Q76_07405 [Rhizobium sp.]